MLPAMMERRWPLENNSRAHLRDWIIEFILESIDFYWFDDEFFFFRDRSILIVRVIIWIILTMMDHQKTFESCNFIKIWDILKFRYTGHERKKKIKNVWISLSPNAQVNLNNLIDNISRTIMAEAINSFKNSRLERYIFHLPLSLFLA